MTNIVPKILIIDTEQYAANFHRQICAYSTGQYGDNLIGQEFANGESSLIKNLQWWNDNIVKIKVHQYLEPSFSLVTPGWFSNGDGTFYKENSLIYSEKIKVPAKLSAAIMVKKFPPTDVWNEFVLRVKKFAISKESIEDQYKVYQIPHINRLSIVGFRQQ